MEEKNHVVRFTPLKDRVHEVGDVHISQEAITVMQDELDQLVNALIKQAALNAKDRDLKTIMPEDAKKAFDMLMKPHTFLDDATYELKATLEKLKLLKNRDIYKFMED